MEWVTVVNRSNRVLQGTWNGRHYDIQPGKSTYPEREAEVFRRQNPVMGSEDLRTGALEYLIGIEEHGDPCDSVEENPKAIERWIRDPNDGTEVVKGRAGLYAHERSAALPLDNSFVDPRR